MSQRASRSLRDWSNGATPNELQSVFRNAIKALREAHLEQDSIGTLTPESIQVDSRLNVILPSAAGKQSDPIRKYGWPKLADRRTPTPQDQIYVLGFIFWEIFTGAVVFQEEHKLLDNDIKWAAWHDNEVPVSLEQKRLQPPVPRVISDLIAKMMEKEPSRRPLELDELDLPDPVSAARFVGVRQWAIGTAVAAAILSSVLAFTLRRGPDAASQPMPAEISTTTGIMRLVGGAVYLDEREVSNELYGRHIGNPYGDNQSYLQSYPNHPVSNVSWEDADKFCRIVKKRLPTAAEWALAAGAHRFPWGDDTAIGDANIGTNTLRDVGVISKDKSPFGILDMAGNLPEWVADEVASGTGGKQYAVRGGAHYLGREFAELGTAYSHPGKIDPSAGYAQIGFRCAVDARSEAVGAVRQ